jgi:hypothetical protein
MTDPTPAPPPPASLGEDFINIFVHPTDVFRRRQNTSVWPPMMLAALVIAAFSYVNVNVLQPVMDAEFARQSARILKSNPQLTQEMLDKGRTFGEIGARYGAIVIVPLAIVVLAFVAWILGKLLGAKQTFHAAIAVVAWSYVPRILDSVSTAVQGLLMDPAKLRSITQLSLSPARFCDPDATNPLLLAVLSRVDVFAIWLAVLVGIGAYATGKLSKEKAAVVGVLFWIVVSLPAIRAGYTAM